MQKITLRHEMACDEETFWYRCIFDREYNERLYLTELRFPRYEVGRLEDDGEHIHKVVTVAPLLPPLPGPVKKVIGDSLAYTESGVFTKATCRYIFTVAPLAVGDKATTSGEMIVQKLADKRILRVANISIDVKVFLVGRLIEDQILTSLRTSYDRATEFTNRFVKEKGY
jgi:hypothetical protein